MAAASALSGYLATRVGFHAMFWAVFIVSIIGTWFLVETYEPLKQRHEHHKIKQEEAFEIKEAEKEEINM